MNRPADCIIIFVDCSIQFAFIPRPQVMRFTIETAVGDEPSAISRASRMASSINWARGTARNTRPISAASLSDTLRPVSSRSGFRCPPTWQQPSRAHLGIKPHRTNGFPASRISQSKDRPRQNHQQRRLWRKSPAWIFETDTCAAPQVGCPWVVCGSPLSPHLHVVRRAYANASPIPVIIMRTSILIAVA